MGLFDWLRRAGDQSAQGSEVGQTPLEQYGREERMILLDLAEKIRSAKGSPLDEIMSVSLGFSATIAALREHYGHHVVENNCPAEVLIAGFAHGGDEARRSDQLLQDLLTDLETYKGDDALTHFRMAWMLNPSALDKAIEDLGKERTP